MDLQYVSAEESDIPVIFAQAKNLIDTYEDVEAIDYDKVLGWVERKIAACISEYRCVIADGERCAWYRLCDDGELDDLYVLPAFQCRGIGTQIMEKCICQSENLCGYMYFPAISGQFPFMSGLAFPFGKRWGKPALS